MRQQLISTMFRPSIGAGHFDRNDGSSRIKSGTRRNARVCAHDPSTTQRTSIPALRFCHCLFVLCCRCANHRLRGKWPWEALQAHMAKNRLA